MFGGDDTPIVDTWWQTETGAAMISPLPGVTSCKPGSAMRALPGISAKIVDDDGNELQPSPDFGEHATGYLVLDKPWPSMLRGIWGDPERFKETYWSRFAEQGWYFAGDGARYGTDGEIWVLGRIDDVMNVSGHRISTAEVESALVGHAVLPRRRSSAPPTRTPGKRSVRSSSSRPITPTCPENKWSPN